MLVCVCECVCVNVCDCICVSVCVCARVRACWRSPFPPWVVTPHGPAWKPALSRAAQLTSPHLPPRLLCGGCSGAVIWKEQGWEAKRPASSSTLRLDWLSSPGQFLVHSGPWFSWKESLACSSLLPQRPREGRGLRGSCQPLWVWLLALEGFPGKRR